MLPRRYILIETPASALCSGLLGDDAQGVAGTGGQFVSGLAAGEPMVELPGSPRGMVWHGAGGQERIGAGALLHPDRWHRKGSPRACSAARAVQARPLVYPGGLFTPSGTGLLRPWAVSAIAISCVVSSQPRRFDRRFRAAARSRCSWRSSPRPSPIAAPRAAGSPEGISWPGRGPSVLEPSASGTPPTAAATPGNAW